LIAAGDEAGDEVICPSFSFIATANVTRHTGAKPVFIDIDPRTYNLNPELLEGLITKRTKALIAVHQVGLPVDMDCINSITARHGIKVIEDAACAIGSEYKGERIGRPHSLAAVFSFHPRKIITAGEGGMITTDDEALATRFRQLRHHGMSVNDLTRHQSKTIILEEYRELGYNYRMTDLQAALGIVQLEKLPEILKQRTALAERYNRAFSETRYLVPPFVPAYAKHNYQSYQLRLKPEAPLSRNDLMQALLERGIASRRGIMASHLEPLYAKEYQNARLPETETATNEALIIPLYPQMTEEEQEYVISNMKELIG
jgi:dTDP-4-amino-4,6-dideoxygalactose transaminase